MGPALGHIPGVAEVQVLVREGGYLYKMVHHTNTFIKNGNRNMPQK